VAATSSPDQRVRTIVSLLIDAKKKGAPVGAPRYLD